jgi:hypothetical protein
VLTAETRTRDAAEPSGEPETLWGRMKGKMGDRVLFGKPEGLEERKAKAKKYALLRPPSSCCTAAGIRTLFSGTEVSIGCRLHMTQPRQRTAA